MLTISLSIPVSYIYLRGNRQSVIISEPLPHVFFSPFVVWYTATAVP